MTLHDIGETLLFISFVVSLWAAIFVPLALVIKTDNLRYLLWLLLIPLIGFILYLQ